MEQPNKKQASNPIFPILTLLTYAAWAYAFNVKDSNGGMMILALISTFLWIITGLAIYSAFRWVVGTLLALVILIKFWLPIGLFLIWPPLFWIWLGAQMNDKD